MLEAVMSLFVSTAWAMGPAPEGGQGGNPIAGFLPLILIFVIFYFLLIRPQQKKAKEHRQMLDAIKKGDKVITSGGIYGLVEAVNQNTVMIKVAENVKIKVGKAYIAAVRTTEED
jgi:preprotein translocase subunit YajC